MKRFLIFALLSFYTFAATGASIHLHFCGEHLIDFSVVGGHAKNCCCKKEKKCEKPGETGINKKCCEDQLASVKITSDQSVKSASSLICFSCIAASSCPCIQLHTSVQRDFPLTVTNAPPLIAKTSLIILVRNIRV